ncbi:hypothetical protein FRC07_001795 [Ceratobasidium sp. 392]|nr:hypothetical protein FRC07_001795 [Ceratobasidium sp. 392]
MAASSAVRVLTTADLTALLADLLKRQDLVKLALTSRGCFKATIDFVWREVWGAHNLLRLIPGVKCTRGAKNGVWTIVLPDLSTADLTQFKSYASCVYSLHILPNSQASYRLSDWKKLSKFAKTITLLPNLRTLAFESDTPKDDIFVRSWILPFLSDKIIAVYTHSLQWASEANISEHRATTLIQAISKRCPVITDLSFFPVAPYYGKSTPADDDEDGQDVDAESSSQYEPEIIDASAGAGLDAADANLSALNLDDYSKLGASESHKKLTPYFEYLKHTRSLQNLTTTWFIIIYSEAIEILAGLPNLKKLELYCSYPNEYIDYELPPIKYPEHPFRSINTLELLFPDMGGITKVWGLKPLVSRLTEVKIRLRADYEYDDGFNDESDDEYAYTRNLIKFMPELCKRSPNIQKLTIDFDASEGSKIQVISLETLKSLVKLPLQTLDLRHTWLEKVPQACRILEQSGTLRNLHLQDQKATYEHLVCFSQIRGLELFHAEVAWNDAQGLEKYKSSPSPRISTVRYLHCSNTLSNQQGVAIKDLLKDILQFTYVRFLKLEEIAWVGTSMYGVGPGVIDPVYAALSEAVKSLRKRVEEGGNTTRSRS